MAYIKLAALTMWCVKGTFTWENHCVRFSRQKSGCYNVAVWTALRTAWFHYIRKTQTRHLPIESQMILNVHNFLQLKSCFLSRRRKNWCQRDGNRDLTTTTVSRTALKKRFSLAFYILVHFFAFCPLQNNVVKWPNWKFYGEREQRTLIFPLFFVT